MFTKKQTDPNLEVALAEAYTKLHSHGITTEEFAKTLDQIIKLNKMKDESSRRVSPDTLALITANLAGIVMILKHEQVNVIATKAMSLVVKPK